MAEIITRTPSALSVQRSLNTLLEGAYWPQSLATNKGYERRHDDTDGDDSIKQYLGVSFGPDGDGWVSTGKGNPLRFRMYSGGGQSLRVRNALLVLAEAIRRDNEDFPQNS